MLCLRFTLLFQGLLRGLGCFSDQPSHAPTSVCALNLSLTQSVETSSVKYGIWAGVWDGKDKSLNAWNVATMPWYDGKEDHTYFSALVKH